MNAETRKKRNFACLAKRDPATLAVLRRVPLVLQPVTLGDDIVDIHFGQGDRFYGGDGREAALAQVRDFLAAPERLTFPDPTHTNFTERSIAVHDTVIRACGDVQLEPAPVADVGLALIFGLGLGFHVGMLAEALPAEHLVVIEPEPQLAHLAMTTIDWAGLTDSLAAQGRRVSLLTGSMEEMLPRLEQLLREESSIFFDGTYFFTHYQDRTGIMEALAARACELVLHYARPGGFLEDERVMMVNSLANLTASPFHLMPPRDPDPQPAPLFIVGAGPSLDDALPVIKQWRGHAVIMSCGSTLGILLKHGITPNIHCEIENSPEVFDFMLETCKGHDLSRVRLLCNTAVDPRLSQLFARRWLYFRLGPSPGYLLDPSDHALTWAEPNVANVAFASAAYLGFRDVYLFGVDLGRRVDTGHHARDSLYMGPLADFYQQAEAPFDTEVPANFGGTVLTHFKLLQARQIMMECQRVAGFNLFNCSDGAALDGARPLAAKSVRLARRVQHEPLLAKLEGKMDAFAAGKSLAGVHLGEIVDVATALRQSLPAELARLRDNAESFTKAWADLVDHLAPASPSDPRQKLLPLVAASFRSMFAAETFFGVRVVNPEVRRLVLRATLDALIPAYDTLLADAIALVRDCERMLP